MESWIDQYAITGMVTCAGMYQMAMFARAVGKSRMQHKVQPPETNGPPEFNRVFRAQQNTVEFYPLSVVSLWTASAFLHPVPASMAYVGYLYARNKYFSEYAASSERRIKPFILSVKYLQIMMVMGMAGIFHKGLRYYGNVDVWKMLLTALPFLAN